MEILLEIMTVKYEFFKVYMHSDIWNFVMYYMYVMSMPSLLIKSINSMIHMQY